MVSATRCPLALQLAEEPLQTRLEVFGTGDGQSGSLLNRKLRIRAEIHH